MKILMKVYKELFDLDSKRMKIQKRKSDYDAFLDNSTNTKSRKKIKSIGNQLIIKLKR